MVINKGASKNVTSASTLGATPSVTNNGTLNIDLSAATAPEDKTTTIRYLAGTEADAVVNTGTDSNVIITLLNETSEEPDKTATPPMRAPLKEQRSSSRTGNRG